jgi:hypothetical protein
VRLTSFSISGADQAAADGYGTAGDTFILSTAAVLNPLMHAGQSGDTLAAGKKPNLDYYVTLQLPSTYQGFCNFDLVQLRAIS